MKNSCVIDKTQKEKRMKKLYSVLIVILAYILLYFEVVVFYVMPDTTLTFSKSLMYITVLVLLCAGTCYYMLYSDSEETKSLRKCAALALTMVISQFLIILFAHLLNLTFLAPFALCGLITSIMLDSKTGFFANFSLILAFFAAQLLFSSAPPSELYYPLFGGMFSSVIASYLTTKNSRRIRYIFVGLQLSLFTVLSTIICYFIFGVSFDATVFFTNIGTAFGSGFLCVMFMFLLVPIFERIFNLSTNFRLSELANTEQALLKRLYDEAPGTFNHCLTVANYAEACAVAIGENPFLARAAAYYHDIGKLKNPNYFTENQNGGVNPHDELTPEASVMAIKKHIIYGLTLAKENHLPPEIERVISEHHGTMPLKFFYLKAKKYTDGELPYDEYRYDGPIPTSKISGIIMIADAAEAALRAGNREDPAKIVNNIIAERMNFNQFVDCDLTMKDIDIIKSTIITTYMGIKHERIKYPKAKLINNEKTNKD